MHYVEMENEVYEEVNLLFSDQIALCILCMPVATLFRASKLH